MLQALQGPGLPTPALAGQAYHKRDEPLENRARCGYVATFARRRWGMFPNRHRTAGRPCNARCKPTHVCTSNRIWQACQGSPPSASVPCREVQRARRDLENQPGQRPLILPRQRRNQRLVVRMNAGLDNCREKQRVVVHRRHVDFRPRQGSDSDDRRITTHFGASTSMSPAIRADVYTIRATCAAHAWVGVIDGFKIGCVDTVKRHLRPLMAVDFNRN